MKDKFPYKMENVLTNKIISKIISRYEYAIEIMLIYISFLQAKLRDDKNYELSDNIRKFIQELTDNKVNITNNKDGTVISSIKDYLDSLFFIDIQKYEKHLKALEEQYQLDKESGWNIEFNKYVVNFTPDLHSILQQIKCERK